MAYRQPGVTVTQQFLNALPALATFALPNVNVGPTFQVKAKQSSGTYTGILGTYAYANQLAGSVIDIRAADNTDLTTYPVKIHFQNTIVRVLTGTVGAVLTGQLNQFTDATSTMFANILVGDVIVVTGSGSGNNGSYTVRSKVDNNTLQTNETFAAAEASLSYTIRRNIGADGSYLEIPTSTVGVIVAASLVTIPASLTTTVSPIGSVPIIQATVLLTYRALRYEYSSDVREYKKLSDLQADFGTDQIVPENTAVFGIFLALANSASATNLLALPKDYLDTGGGSGDEGIAYGKAFDVLSVNDMYAINIMTHSTSIHTALKAHVDLFSQPDRKLERVGIINRQLVTTSVVVPQLTNGATNSTGLIFTSSTGNFLTNGVVPGHYIKISAPSGAVGRYKISSVDSQTQVTLSTAVAGSNPQSSITFVADKDLTKSEQASVLAAYAHSIGDRRMVMTWPDVVKIPSSNIIRELPGYYLNCAVAALTTGLPTQQGLTNLSVSTYVGVVHSTKYFDADQMNAIADGGVMIFVQDILDQTALYVRHQLTTDRSAIKFQEYSVTKNVDFIAKFIRNNHKQFIGQYNIVDSTFDDLKTNAKGISTYLKEATRAPKIGGVVRSMKLQSIIQDPVNIDSIQEQYSADIPIPLNNLDITLFV